MTRRVLASAIGALLLSAVPASATPVCTDGYMGGPPASQCGGRIFPEAASARAYVQYLPDPTGFREYQHGLEYLAQKYPRWISVFKLSDRYGKLAVTAGPDAKRAGEDGDTGDGYDILVVKITDHNVSDEGKRNLLFSLSVHGNERGGLEGGLRTAEDLAMAATDGGKISDGVANYESTTGRAPAFHEYEARDLLAQETVYLVDFNIDGWAVGDLWATTPLPFGRGNSIGTDLNRQMPTVGRINPERNPLTENEMKFGHKLMHDVAAMGRGGKLAHGTDIHGEVNSQAFVDIMYPAGQFDSADHRRLMSIAERTKSVIDATLFQGAVEQTEDATGGNDAEAAQPVVPTKPAHWASVWDTLGYTDTGFIGDYMATDLAVTGMDYEFAYNHSVPDKVWNVFMQENFINGARAIIKVAMAYALTQEEEFSEKNLRVDPKGRAGYVVNPKTVTDTDENGPGALPGPKQDGIGADGRPVVQAHYEATNQRWFAAESRFMPQPFVPLAAADVARDGATLDLVDTLVLADVPLPPDRKGRAVDAASYYRNLKAWVERGGNLVLTDRALHALGDMGVVGADKVTDASVYLPYANIGDLTHPLVKGLRPNARQLVEFAVLGGEIGNDASPITVVDKAAWEGAGGKTVGTTGDGSGTTDDGTRASLGELKLGRGLIRIVGGALPMPIEANDHRYGLRDFAQTYTGLFVMENAIEHDAPGLGEKPLPPELTGDAGPAATKPPGRCLPGRRLTVRISGRSSRRLRVTANGRRVRIRRSGRRLVARVELKRYRGKVLTVRVRRGRKLVKTVRYRVCK